jgi:hypothetical protein
VCVAYRVPALEFEHSCCTSHLFLSAAAQVICFIFLIQATAIAKEQRHPCFKLTSIYADCIIEGDVMVCLFVSMQAVGAE